MFILFSLEIDKVRRVSTPNKKKEICLQSYQLFTIGFHVNTSEQMTQRWEVTKKLM